jgi:hypothetical protein
MELSRATIYRYHYHAPVAPTPVNGIRSVEEILRPRGLISLGYIIDKVCVLFLLVSPMAVNNFVLTFSPDFISHSIKALVLGVWKMIVGSSAS